MALNREQRRAMLAQELDGEETAVEQVDVVDAPVVAPVAPAPVAVMAPEQIAAIAQIVAATLAAMPQNSDVGEQISRALRDNRQPIPENTDASYHARSHYHPGGIDVPRPMLAVPTFLGLWDLETGKAIPRYPIEEGLSTDAEIEALNKVQPGSYTIARNDGSEVLARVVDVKDAQDHVRHRVIAFPPQQFEKEHRNALPSIASIAAQMVA